MSRSRPPHEFHYHIHWRSNSLRPGHHHGSQSGSGFQLHGHSPLLSSRDPRHLDIHASLHDPFGEFVVRTFKQRSSIPVYAIADLSASMGFEGRHSKLDQIATVSASIAYSAARTGDAFGFLGCAEQPIPALSLPLRRSKGIPADFLRQLRNFQASGRSSQGLLELAPHLGQTRSLLFLLSDFHFPLPQLETLLTRLGHHDIVPVVFWDNMEYQHLPKRGLIRFYDAESKQTRSLFMRPALHARIQADFAERRYQLERLCSTFGRKPFFINGAFDPDQMTDYFFRH